MPYRLALQQGKRMGIALRFPAQMWRSHSRAHIAARRRHIWYGIIYHLHSRTLHRSLYNGQQQ